MEIEFKGVDNEGVVEKFAWIKIGKRPWNIALAIVVSIILVILGLFLICSPSLLHSLKGVRTLLEIWGTACLVGAYWLGVRPWMQPILKSLKPSQEITFRHISYGTVSTQGMVLFSGDESEHIPWERVYKIGGFGESLVLYAEYSNPMRFTSEFFKNDAEWSRFRSWARYYVRRANKSKPK